MSSRILGAQHQASPILPALKAAIPASIPVMAGYIFLGTAYGVLMGHLGYTTFWTVFMSLVIFGGSIQFAATGLLAAGFQPLNALILSLTVNARHIFYGFSMLERYADAGWKKPLLVFWLSDETFALVCSDVTPPNVDATWYRFFISALDYSYWVAGSLLGGVAGSLLDFDSTGIDFVMTALFLVIVIEQWRNAKTHAPALIGFACTVICLIAFGPAHFIIPAMICIVAALMAGRRRLEKVIRREEEEEACGQ